jgi:hypothetical protein
MSDRTPSSLDQKRPFLHARWVLVAVTAWLCMQMPVRAELTPSKLEADADMVKAALVLNLAKFVTGSPERFAPGDEFFHIGIMGSPHLIEAFDSIEGKTVGGRLVKVHSLKELSTVPFCQVMYSGPGHEKEFHRKVLASPNPQVLSICEGRIKRGNPCIVFITKKDQRLALSIYRGKAEAAGLRFSSRLLNLATVIEE